MHPHSPAGHLDARVRTAWQAQMAAARKVPGLLPTLLQHPHELLPRFADYYQHLHALPRRARRTLERRWRQTLAGVALLLALGIADPSQAATIPVDGTICTLADAIRAANTEFIAGGCLPGAGADTIVLPPGSTQTLAAALPAVTSVITVEGNGSTIKRNSGAPKFVIFSVREPGALTLKETTLSGGDSIDGGAIYNYFGTVTLTNTTISGNAASQGGGLNNFAGALSLTDSTVSGNIARNGDGGGIYNAFGNVTVTNSTISGNRASSDGGGIYTFGGSVTVTNSTISGNTSTTSNGGAVACTASAATSR